MSTDGAPSSTVRWLARLLGAALLLAVVSCGSDSWGVKESDVPSEATLAFPGSELRTRGWDPGSKGTYIDGGSTESRPRLTLTYDVAATDPEELLHWYESQLQQRDFAVEKDRDPTAIRVRALLGANRVADGFDVDFGILGVVHDDGTLTSFTVTVVVTPT
jgi:hypothetical protein